MVTPPEIGAMNAALAGALMEVERAEAAAGSEWLDAIRWLYTAGSAQVSARLAARSARALYDGLVQLRNRAIESVDEEHELALQVVEVANRLSGRGTAASIEALEEAASYGTMVKAAWDGAVFTAKALTVAALAVVAFIAWRALR